MPPPGPRALVVTAGRARGALAGVRALRRAGWSVGVGTPDGSGMVTASRGCERAHVVPRPRGDGAAFVAGVRRAVHDGGYDVVFGGGDDWVAGLATYRNRLPVVVAHPSAAAVRVALDKVELARRAASVGLAAPRTEVATPRAVASWSGPVVVKCRAHWHAGQVEPHRIEARRYDSVQEAAPRLQALHGAGFSAVLQVPVDEELAGRVSELLADWQWSGLVELQFLTDAAGTAHLIDVNARFYGSMAPAVAAGANLPDAWGRQALGLPLPPLPDARPGVRFVWTAGDLRRARAERRGGLLADVGSTVRWFCGATTSVKDRRDLGPTAHLLTERLRARRGSGQAAGARPVPAAPLATGLSLPAPALPLPALPAPARAERAAR